MSLHRADLDTVTKDTVHISARRSRFLSQKSTRNLERCQREDLFTVEIKRHIRAGQKTKRTSVRTRGAEPSKLLCGFLKSQPVSITS